MGQAGVGADAEAGQAGQPSAAGDDPVVDELERLGAAYEIVPCDPTLADTAEFCAAYGFTAQESANAIVVTGKSDPPVHVMCLVLADSRVDVNHTVRKRLGVRRASFASAHVTMELTAMEIGGVTPFGTSTPMPLWIDARVMDLQRVIVGGGSRDRKVLVAPSVLAAHPRAEVIDGLGVPASG